MVRKALKRSEIVSSLTGKGFEKDTGGLKRDHVFRSHINTNGQ